MATQALPQREIIRFEAGRPETVRLKYSTGKEVQGRSGAQFMFTTADDRIFFLDADIASLVEKCAPAGEPIRITKTKGPRNTTNWDVRAGASPAPAAPTVSASTTSGTPAPTSITETEPPVITPLAAKLCSSMCALIDAMSEAKAYAVRRHIDLTNEDLRALAATAFIQEARR